jgi:hypothetical protein
MGYRGVGVWPVEPLASDAGDFMLALTLFVAAALLLHF